MKRGCIWRTWVRSLRAPSWKIWGWTLRISLHLIYMWMLVWEAGLILLREAQLGEMAWQFSSCMSLHRSPREIPAAQALSTGSTGPGAASSDHAQVWPELRRISLMLPCFCPQPSWGCAAVWPGESRDSKKRRLCCKRRRHILSVLLFLTGKKRDRELKFSQTAGLKVT